MLLATFVAIITCLAVANATQTIITPNAASISYNLAPGADSAPITPATNKPVLVMGCCTTGSFQGVGQVRLLHIPSTWIIWFGLDTISPATITSGTSATAGRHVVYIDFSARLDIQVNSADTIKVHNGDTTVTKAGNVTLIW